MRALSAASVLACLVFLGGCALFAKLASKPAPPPPSGEPSTVSLDIPPGQLPPPGTCRVWVPDTAPGQQKPSGPCMTLKRQVPSGGWLLYRSEEKANEVEVNVYRSSWPKVVAEVRYFDYWTGRLLRVEGGP